LTLLEVRDLHVWFDLPQGAPVHAAAGVSFALAAGERFGLVGESGCGKTTTILALMGLLPPNASLAGEVLVDGRNILAGGEDSVRGHRWKDVAMVFQGAMNAMNPVKKIGWQIAEPMAFHGVAQGAAARRRAGELLELVGIPASATERYPHELSGGMRQRAMIAMALVNDPHILIADEPTTALDVTIQAQILHLIQELQERLGMAVILITHDLGVVADTADYINVMYAGRIVEAGTLDEIFYDPQHPYTWGLLGSVARPDRPRTERLSQIQGQPPSLLAPPQGCHFRPRCPHEFDKCKQTPPLDPRSATPGHLDRCWLSPEQKRTLRTIQGDQIGLEVPAA
jgi:peptide/nickel transport system ATP-binding protein